MIKPVSLTEQNYLKCIYTLAGGENKKVLTTDIAQAINIKAATVTDMLGKLGSKKLIDYEKYYGAKLTGRGRVIALNVIRKHRLWEVFLADKLGFGWDEVHGMAEDLEHATSDVLTDRLEKFLGNPKTGPHGDPIPNHKGQIEKPNYPHLHEVEVEQQFFIKTVANEDSKLLKYLEKNSLIPGSKVIVKEINEFDGSLAIKVNNKTMVYVSKEVAKNLLVSKK